MASIMLLMIGDTLANDVECGAVIHGSAHDGQSQGYIHGLSEGD